MSLQEVNTSYRTLVTPDLHPNIGIVHSGRDVGNTDPRFGEPEEVVKARSIVRGFSTDTDEVFVMRAKGGSTFTDLADRANPNIENDDLDEIPVLGDGLITREPGVGLMLNTADCIPLVIYQPGQKILALIHLGWRGAVDELHSTMLDYMIQRHDFEPGGALAYLGPSISKESYTAESLSDVQKTDPKWSDAIEKREDTYHIDIPQFVIQGLIRAGIPASNIGSTEIDTGAETEHFSLTRHKRYAEPNGRNGFLVTIKH